MRSQRLFTRQIESGIFLVVVIAKTFIFSLKRRGKGGRKGREREERREERRRGEIGMYRRLCISAGMGPLTLKLFASYRRFCEICAASNTRIHFSKSLVKHVLVYIVNL